MIVFASAKHYSIIGGTLFESRIMLKPEIFFITARTIKLILKIDVQKMNGRNNQRISRSGKTQIVEELKEETQLI